MAGEREIVAKGVALGIAQAARAEGRAYILFTFGADRDPVCVVSSEQDWPQHLDWAEYSRGGGTSFNKALAETMNHLTKLGQCTKGADALFISDGEARVAADVAGTWQRFRRDHGARLMYVPVAHGYGSIEHLADLIIPVSQLDQATGEALAYKAGTWLR
jgi:uncharacterized protein with von Willebrand factor type A (vWA) domain